MCGENFVILSIVFFLKGSPPRVRGKLIGLGQLGAGSRITPACAGKTWRAKKPIAQDKDHPRVCGENKVSSVIGT